MSQARNIWENERKENGRILSQNSILVENGRERGPGRTGRRGITYPAGLLTIVQILLLGKIDSLEEKLERTTTANFWREPSVKKTGAYNSDALP